MRKFFTAALAAVACFGAAGAVATTAQASYSSSRSYQVVTNDCLRYTGCTGITRWQTWQWNSGGLYGVDSHTRDCYYFHTAYFGYRYATYTYNDLFARPDSESYVQPSSTCSIG